MKAIRIAAGDDPHLRLRDVDDPVAGPRDVLIRVTHVAMNPGEVKAMDRYVDGDPIGWDFVGVVEQAATIGDGPVVGTRVVGSIPTGAWAQRVSVPADMVAAVPDGVSDQTAVCVPVPCMTAYLALRHGGLLIGKRVLVTGGAGAVGQAAIQLAARSGGNVHGVVRRREQTAMVREAGAAEVHVTGGIESLRGGEPFDLIVDMIGGGVAADAAKLLTRGGTYVIYSTAGGAEMTLPTRPLMTSAARVAGFYMFQDLRLGNDTAAEVLTRLLRLVVQEHLKVRSGDTHDWRDADRVRRDYMKDSDRSKPVLTID